MEGPESVDALRARIAELEKELAARERANARLEAVLEAVPSIVMHVDGNLRLLDVNHPVAGYTVEQVRGSDFLSHTPESERAHIERALRSVLESGKPATYSTVGPGPDGTVSRYESYVAPLRIDGSPGELIVVAIDVTAQHTHASQLRERDLLISVASEATGLGLWVWDVATDRVTWNAGMFAITGVDEPIALSEYRHRLVHPDDAERVGLDSERALRDDWFEGIPHRIVRPDGEIRWVVTHGHVERDASGAIVSVVGSTLDITAHHEAEARRSHEDRLAAVGRLAAGVSHNFNNQLATIAPVLDLVRPHVEGRELDAVDDALHAVRRSTDLVRQLLAFARRRDIHTMRPEPFEAVVERAVEMGKKLVDSRIDVQFSTSARGAYVRCDAGAIEQAVINLIVNARDAIVDRGRPRGRIAVSIELDPHGARSDVVLRISDDGTGMDDAVSARIFEPFFTTKDAGQGTGLGLSVTYATVESHHASIRCESSIGIGTTFELRFPAIEAPRFSDDEITSTRARGRTVRIVLADDDDGVRQVVSMWLEHMGHTVEIASSVEQIVETLAEGQPFDLLLLDRSLAEGHVEQAIERIRAVSPRTFIAYFSGDEVPDAEIALADYVLPKPTSSDAIDAMIHALFGTGESEPAVSLG